LQITFNRIQSQIEWLYYTRFLLVKCFNWEKKYNPWNINLKYNKKEIANNNKKILKFSCKCFYYKIPRHKIKNCKKWIAKEANKTNWNQVNISKTKDHLFIVVCASTNNIVEQNVWYVDSRVTQHMTPQKDLFHDYIPFLTLEMVYFGDNTFHKVEGHGSMIIKFPRKVIKYLQKVSHVLRLCKNLILVNQVVDSRHKLEFTMHLF
jgi:hypothetical protein